MAEMFNCKNIDKYLMLEIIICKVILQGLLFLLNEIACINLELTALIIHF